MLSTPASALSLGIEKNVLLWSHYADHHKGICMAFEPAHHPSVFWQAVSVEYSDDFPIVNWLGDFDAGIAAALLRKSMRPNEDGSDRLSLDGDLDRPHRRHPPGSNPLRQIPLLT